MRRLLVDGDAVLYRVAASLQKEVWWDEENWVRTIVMNVKDAIEQCDTMLEDLTMKVRAGSTLVLIGPTKKQSNFRRTIWPAYKAKRRGADVPVGLGKLREKMMECSRFVVEESDMHLEADDMIGFYATYTTEYFENIVWSPDKDLLQIPGLHLDEEGREFDVTPDRAEWWHMVQTLAGDSADGYPGCPDIGLVRAKRMLEETQPSLWWLRVVESFERAGKSEEDALVQARVARIWRHGERWGQWLPPGGLIRVH